MRFSLTEYFLFPIRKCVSNSAKDYPPAEFLAKTFLSSPESSQSQSDLESSPQASLFQSPSEPISHGTESVPNESVSNSVSKETNSE